MTNINDNKKAYLDYKEKLLADIKYYENSIEEFRANNTNNNFYGDNSSDSDDDWLSAIDIAPRAVDLKMKRSQLGTYLQATQELTGLTVLQFEINVLVQEPTLDGEPPVSEAGIWREVAAECRIDLVPFSITFFVHTPNRKFGQPSYRGVRVVLVKSTHELELSKSILDSLKRPSDAIEVLRSYAVSYRSRRTSLARLSNTYTNILFLEPHIEGGFVLLCPNLLKVVWRLENKGSPVAPFHHKMNSNLEFIVKSYLKDIRQYNNQLSDPTIGTDDRTLILAKIIDTCLKAKGSKANEALSDLESQKQDSTVQKDSEVMAPPKSLPRKAKTKSGQENANADRSDGVVSNDDSNENTPNMSNAAQTDPAEIQKAQKRSMDNNTNNSSKRMKSNDTNINKIPQTKNSNTDTNKDGNTKLNTDKAKKTIATSKNKAPSTAEANENITDNAKDVNTNNNKEIATKISANTKQAKSVPVSDNANAKTKSANVKTKAKTDAPPKNLPNPADAKTAGEQNSNYDEEAKNKVAKAKNKIKSGSNTKMSSTDVNNINKMDLNCQTNMNKNVITTSDKRAQINKDSTNGKTKNDVAKSKNDVANTKNDVAKTKNVVAKTKNDAAKTKNNVAKTKNDVAKTKNDVAKTKKVAKNNNLIANSENIVEDDPKSAVRMENNENIHKNIMVTEKNIATAKTKDNISNRTVDSHILPNFKSDKIISGKFNNRFSKNISLRTGNIKKNRIIKSGNIEKENGMISKIPQKILTPNREKSLKSNPLRISPRTFASKFKTNNHIMKSTSIPRLLKK